jgi:hypothetical protein
MDLRHAKHALIPVLNALILQPIALFALVKIFPLDKRMETHAIAKMATLTKE